jgi:hypothetical protein
MNSFGPLLGTFAFFALMFFIGRHLQNKEKQKRIEQKAKLAAESVERELHKVSPGQRWRQGESIVLDEVFGSAATQSTQAYGASQGGHT